MNKIDSHDIKYLISLDDYNRNNNFANLHKQIFDNIIKLEESNSINIYISINTGFNSFDKYKFIKIIKNLDSNTIICVILVANIIKYLLAPISLKNKKLIIDYLHLYNYTTGNSILINLDNLIDDINNHKIYDYDLDKFKNIKVIKLLKNNFI